MKGSQFHLEMTVKSNGYQLHPGFSAFAADFAWGKRVSEERFEIEDNSYSHTDGFGVSPTDYLRIRTVGRSLTNGLTGFNPDAMI